MDNVSAFTAAFVAMPTFSQMAVAISNHHARSFGPFAHEAQVAMRPGERLYQQHRYGNAGISSIFRKDAKFLGASVVTFFTILSDVTQF